ncbi:MAG TPA: type II secretion system protein [Anaerohalosphaeraceae bacterium]|nr:type II secretion system protein [Anaerohalosphaeraceae bacterium]HOL88987.1 type II secretion system protein [Anaerohalosphaeraceae bacterium]HPP57366.1 type II secretion system protein [Anaerohalosphaeraceae bacterium]
MERRFGKYAQVREGQAKGFTLIELLVVIAIIALLLAVLIPALSRAKLYAQKVLCTNDLKQQALGTLLYSNDNDSQVPLFKPEQGATLFWLWDVLFETTNQLSHYAGFDDNKTFFCPANKVKRYDDARFWQFSWLGSGPYPNPVPLREERGLNTKAYYRVLPYIYMFEAMVDSSGTLRSTQTPELVNPRERAKWIRRISQIQAASSRELIMDAVISNGTNRQTSRFDQLTEGGIDELSGGTLWDNTNHFARQRNNVSLLPEGGIVSFADGHAEWRNFSRMNPRVATNNMWFWW